MELLRLGARDKPIILSTIDLSTKIGKTQQTASNHLQKLEDDGYIERIRGRDGTAVKLTSQGISSIGQLHSMLNNALEDKSLPIETNGILFTGLGEGAYYISLRGYKKQFIKRIGFEPFPGTLNLKLTTARSRRIRRDITQLHGIAIDGFDDKGRTYGGAICFKAKINEVIDGAVILIERSHYDDSVLEIIAPVSIRKKLGVADGDTVRIDIFTDYT